MNAPLKHADLRLVEPSLSFTPSGAALGAEVDGVDLRDDLTPAQAAEIRAALLRYKVLFFHDQNITPEQQIRFGRHFGELEGHPVTQHLEGHPEVLRIRNGEYQYVNELTLPFIRPTNKWHADVTFREAPSMGGILRAVQTPTRGGDTLFADMAAVYNDLPASLREQLDGYTATHDIMKCYAWRLDQAGREQLAAKHPPISHPVVRVHPETGEKSLYVNHGFTTKIDQLPEQESEDLLTLLYDRVKCPEYQVRFKWTPHAVVFWDNRGTQHYPVADYWPEDREVQRVTVAGDRPFGPNAA